MAMRLRGGLKMPNLDRVETVAVAAAVMKVTTAVGPSVAAAVTPLGLQGSIGGSSGFNREPGCVELRPSIVELGPYGIEACGA